MRTRCPTPPPLEATAGGVVRLHMSLGSVKIVQLTEGGKRKKKKIDCTVAGHKAENDLGVYQGSSMMVSSTHSPQG